jgi:hypothetical protein
MGATSFLECCDWTYLVGTDKYGRKWNGKKVEKWAGKEVWRWRLSDKLFEMIFLREAL